MTDRTPREADTRDDDARLEEWTPVDLLPDPEPMAGWAFRWVRKSLMGDVDTINMSRRTREGWVPVSATEQPLLAASSESKDHIELGGLILCKLPAEREAARQRYYNRMAEQQLTGLEDNLRGEAGEDRRMPIEQTRQTKVSRSPR